MVTLFLRVLGRFIDEGDSIFAPEAGGVEFDSEHLGGCLVAEVLV